MDNSLYNNWYVLCVTTGKEHQIREVLSRYSPAQIDMRIFERELIHYTKGHPVKVLNPVFPGYIFVHEKVSESLSLSRKILRTEFVHCINVRGVPSRVDQLEMRLLMELTDNQGIFSLSYGFKQGDEIVISEGPLKNVRGRIQWIDEKKKKARVYVNLFKRKININLGLDLLERRSARHCA